MFVTAFFYQTRQCFVISGYRFDGSRCQTEIWRTGFVVSLVSIRPIGRPQDLAEPAAGAPPGSQAEADVGYESPQVECVRVSRVARPRASPESRVRRAVPRVGAPVHATEGTVRTTRYSSLVYICQFVITIETEGTVRTTRYSSLVYISQFVITVETEGTVRTTQ